MPIIDELLRDDYSFEEAEGIQIKYQSLVNKSSKDNEITNIEQIKTVVGVDISYYTKENYEYGIACAVSWNLKQNSKENQFFIKDQIKFPYKPGFLGFRECKIMAKVISKLPKRPDLIMCDSHGKIHPRRFGEATQLGLALDISSIGIAKNPFVGYSDWDKIEKFKGNKSAIWAENPNVIGETKSNELLGYAICLKNGSKPVFISTGYCITLDAALKICLESTKEHRQPEPLYLADKLSREEINNYI
ncbi:MAG: endonuclease V [Promethearchaeota archaeon]